MSPAFLYGHTEEELVEIAGTEGGRALMDLRGRFMTIAQLDPSVAPILPLRVFRAPAPSAVSLREPVEVE